MEDVPLESADAEPGGETRWGLGDVLLGVPFILVIAAIVGFVAVAAAGGFDDDSAIPLSASAIALAGQQLAQGSWPAIVARWKGNGIVRDFRLRFSWHDLWIGPVTAILMLILASSLAAAVERLVDLQDAEEGSNTQFFEDAADSPWRWLLAFLIAVGAPVAEELFFRGLVLRAAEKRWNTNAGIAISTVLFTIPHYSGAGWQGTAVLFTAIACIGLALAIVTVKTNRLGPAIIAHMCFNGLVVTTILAS